MSVGFDPDRFWDLTPRLYVLQMKGASDRLRRERDDRTEQAWLTAMLSRAKEVPPLEKLLTPKKARKMSQEELQIMFDALAASWGATMQ